MTLKLAESFLDKGVHYIGITKEGRAVPVIREKLKEHESFTPGSVEELNDKIATLENFCLDNNLEGISRLGSIRFMEEDSNGNRHIYWGDSVQHEDGLH